jgi:hypothetical protein
MKKEIPTTGDKQVELLRSLLRDPTVPDEEKSEVRERLESLEIENQKQQNNDLT